MTVQRNKSWGYEVEVQAKESLKAIWPEMDRTGASNQKVSADPDLVVRGPDPICLVVSKEKGSHKPLVIHLMMEDFIILTQTGPEELGVAVQVKGRAKLWVDGVLRALRENVSKNWNVDGSMQKCRSVPEGWRQWRKAA